MDLAFGLASAHRGGGLLPESAARPRRGGHSRTILARAALARSWFAIIDAESAGFGSPS